MDDIDLDRKIFVSSPQLPPSLLDPPEISPPWDTLPSDILRMLDSDHGIAVEDLRLTCQSWRFAFPVRELKPLVLYEDGNNALNVFSPFPLGAWVNDDFSLNWSDMGFKFLKVADAEGIESKKMFLGCSYGYLVSIDQFFQVQMVNPFTRNTIQLPHLPRLGYADLGSVITKAILDSDPEDPDSSDNFWVVLLCRPGIAVFVARRNNWKLIESKSHYSDISFTQDGTLCAVDCYGTRLDVWDFQTLDLCFDFVNEQFDSMTVPKRIIDIEYHDSFPPAMKNQYHCSCSLVLCWGNKFLQIFQSVDSTSTEYSPIFHLYEYDIPNIENRIVAEPVYCVEKTAIFLGLNKGKIVPSHQYGVEGNSIYFVGEWHGSMFPWLGIYSLNTRVSRLLPLPNGTVPSWLIPYRYASEGSAAQSSTKVSTKDSASPKDTEVTFQPGYDLTFSEGSAAKSSNKVSTKDSASPKDTELIFQSGSDHSFSEDCEDSDHFDCGLKENPDASNCPEKIKSSTDTDGLAELMICYPKMKRPMTRSMMRENNAAYGSKESAFYVNLEKDDAQAAFGLMMPSMGVRESAMHVFSLKKNGKCISILDKDGLFGCQNKLCPEGQAVGGHNRTYSGTLQIEDDTAKDRKAENQGLGYIPHKADSNGTRGCAYKCVANANGIFLPRTQIRI